MKRLAYLITLTLVLVSCGSRSGHFKLEGRLLNLNQGEFYIYSTDGVFAGIDTIKVDGGRFAYETPCTANGTLVIVFPNYSEQPVFAQPGKTVTIKGDASHLKEIEITGTDENKLMDGFRKQTAKASPPETLDMAEKFIKDNPSTLAAVYLLRKYFVTASNIDYSKTLALADLVYKAQPKHGEVARILHHARMMSTSVQHNTLPRFTASDISGNTVTDADLKGKIAVVYSWASWDAESRNMADRLKSLRRDNGSRLVLLGISIDATLRECRSALYGDSTQVLNICDQRMFESPLIETFTISGVSDNIIYNAQGRVVARGLNTTELENKLRLLLNL